MSRCISEGKSGRISFTPRRSFVHAASLFRYRLVDERSTSTRAKAEPHDHDRHQHRRARGGASRHPRRPPRGVRRRPRRGVGGVGRDAAVDGVELARPSPRPPNSPPVSTPDGGRPRVTPSGRVRGHPRRAARPRPRRVHVLRDRCHRRGGAGRGARRAARAACASRRRSTRSSAKAPGPESPGRRCSTCWRWVASCPPASISPSPTSRSSTSSWVRAPSRDWSTGRRPASDRRSSRCPGRPPATGWLSISPALAARVVGTERPCEMTITVPATGESWVEIAGSRWTARIWADEVEANDDETSSPATGLARPTSS